MLPYIAAPWILWVWSCHQDPDDPPVTRLKWTFEATKADHRNDS